MESQIKFIVGETRTGFDAYYENNGVIIAVAIAKTLEKLKENALEAYNLYAKKSGKYKVDNVIFDFDKK